MVQVHKFYCLFPGDVVEIELGQATVEDTTRIFATSHSQASLSICLYAIASENDTQLRKSGVLQQSDITIELSGFEGHVFCCISNLSENETADLDIEACITNTAL